MTTIPSGPTTASLEKKPRIESEFSRRIDKQANLIRGLQIIKLILDQTPLLVKEGIQKIIEVAKIRYTASQQGRNLNPAHARFNLSDRQIEIIKTDAKKHEIKEQILAIYQTEVKKAAEALKATMAGNAEFQSALAALETLPDASFGDGEFFFKVMVPLRELLNATFAAGSDRFGNPCLPDSPQKTLLQFVDYLQITTGVAMAVDILPLKIDEEGLFSGMTFIERVTARFLHEFALAGGFIGNLPDVKGALNKGEGASDAAERELREETGLVPLEGTELEQCDARITKGRDPRGPIGTVPFVALAKGDSTASTDEGTRMAFDLSAKEVFILLKYIAEGQKQGPLMPFDHDLILKEGLLGSETFAKQLILMEEAGRVDSLITEMKTEFWHC